MPDMSSVAGQGSTMRWLQATWTIRHKVGHRLRRHLFQGRYKAIIVDPQAETHPHSSGLYSSQSDACRSPRSGEEAERLPLEQLFRYDRDTSRVSRRACGGAFCENRAGGIFQKPDCCHKSLDCLEIADGRPQHGESLLQRSGRCGEDQ